MSPINRWRHRFVPLSESVVLVTDPFGASLLADTVPSILPRALLSELQGQDTKTLSQC